jgi:hypothetical protein
VLEGELEVPGLLDHEGNPSFRVSTGVLGGEPSGIRVARRAKFRRSSRGLTSADRG